MATSARPWLALFILLAAGISPLFAQDGPPTDPATPFVPLRAEEPQERDRRESLKQYALGLLCQRADRLVEALSAYELAARLDPDAAPVQQALIPLYMALERGADALRVTRKALDLDPDSQDTWYLFARQLRAQGKFDEACTALRKALGCSEVKERPDLAYQLHCDLGVLHERAGEAEPAITEFRESLKILPHADVPPEQAVLRAAETHERIGRLCVQLRQFDKAVAAFRQAQQAYPEGASRLNFNLAQVCQEEGKPTDALRYLDAYLKEQPQGTEAYELKAALLRKLDRAAEVVPWLEQASNADRYNVRLKVLLARSYAEAHQGEKAEKVYGDLAAQTPAAEIYQGLFRLYRGEPKLGMRRALALFDRTFAAARDRQDPNQVTALAQVKAMLLAVRDDAELTRALLDAAGPAAERRMEPETMQTLGTLAEHAGRLEQAETCFRAALRDSKGTDAEGKPVLYAGLLKVLGKQRKYGEIIEVCRDALRTAKDADCVVYHAELARALTQLERFGDALREADSAVQMANPTDRLGAKILRIRILTQGGYYERAEKEALALLREQTLPGEVLELHYLLSSVYSAAGQVAKAEEQLAQCLKLDPDNATLNNDLGYLWADQNKNLDKAEEMIRKAIELDRQSRQGPLAAADKKDAPDNAAYIDSLGWVLYRKGDLTGARRELEKASRLPEGEDPVIWDHLGDVYLRLRMRDAARTAFERAAHFYQRERRGKMDGRYHELQQKLKLLGASEAPH